VIELTPGLATNVIVALAHGTVTADDYEKILIPAVSMAAESGDKLRMLYVLGEDFEGFEAGAGLDDAKLGLHHWGDFDRIGLVTDHEGYRAMTKAIGFLMPGEVRVFAVADLPAAREWISAV
jgi:SpoIIAA-like